MSLLYVVIVLAKITAVYNVILIDHTSCRPQFGYVSKTIVFIRLCCVKHRRSHSVFAHLALSHAAGWLAELESTVEQPLRPNTQSCNDNRTQK